MSLLSLFNRPEPLDLRIAACRASLFRLALMWCHDRALADDLTQEALAKALAAAGQLRDPARLRTWLFGILANGWRDHLRARRPMEDIETVAEQWLVGGDCPEQALDQSRLALRVRQAIGRLPMAQREVLGLVDLDSFSYAQVAEILALPIGTVMSRLCRARAALRLHLADDRQVPLRRVK